MPANQGGSCRRNGASSIFECPRAALELIVEFGLDLARRTVEEVVRRGLFWDFPLLLDPARKAPLARVAGDVPALVGADWGQNMMLWSLPAAMQGENLAEPCAPGGLVDRALKAAAK
jgi:hypothetical protein